MIKLDYNVNSVNEFLTLTNPGSFDPNNPRTWKYYLNVSGQYHSTDTLMYVTSLDTLEEIVFNQENLISHKATKRAYQYGTRFYKELVNKYKNQETLIQGILYPIDIDKAISAKDGEIIGYPDHFVEPNEFSLISRLQTWINGYLFRWVNHSFSIAHDLYYLTIYSIFYSLLPQTILQLRHEMCRTNEAHSFHVKQFLASHGGLDKYYDQMTLKQSLWLYRNIHYVKKNLGFTDTFDMLTEHIMTDRNIPLSGYTGFHDVEKMPDNLYPEISFKKVQINPIAAIETTNPLPLQKMLIKEDKLARNNYEVRMNNESTIQEDFENSRSNKMLTKALETTLFDYSGSSPYNLEDILLNHWMYLACIDKYKAYVQLENPRTGEVFSLSVKDAFVFGYYLFCKSFNLELIEVPIVPAIRVQRIPMASIDDIYSVVDHSLIPRELAVEMLDQQPLLNDNIISTEDFYNKCDEIFKVANYQRGLTALQENYYRRALSQNMASRIYCDYICHFDTDHKLYTDWFNERNIVIEDYLLTSTYEAWLEILKKATGVDIRTTNSLASIQQAMTNIMVSLSSYSIQFLNDTNSSPIRLLENPTVRPGFFDTQLKHAIHLSHEAIRVLRHYGKNKTRHHIEMAHCGFKEVVKMVLKDKLDFEITVKPNVPDRASRRLYQVNTSCVSAKVLNVPDDNEEGIISVPGIDIYLEQTTEDRIKIIDMYNPCYWNYANKR